MAVTAAGAHETVLDVLYEWAQLQKNQTIWSFLDDKGKVVDRLTYGELVNQGQAVAAHLLASGVQPGDRVMLVFFPSLQFTVCLIGCFMAGVIAVPVFPPDPRRLRKDLDHFATIQQSSGSRVALTQSSYNYAKKMADIKNVFTRQPGDAQWPELQWIVVDSILSSAKEADMSALPRAKASDIAFLQYTSGSTSEPKGVMIGHDNLLHNLNLIVRDLQADQSTVVVSWLPQYHDMGLIGSYLGILRCGGCGYYMSPFSFLKNPLVWLQCISTYRGTHMQAPNFAFALTVRKFNEYAARSSSRLELDLSSVRHMINAAEPVDEVAIDSFYETFRPFGLPDGVVYPTYGLAEHVVFVCSGGTQRLYVQKSVFETEQRIVQVPRGSEDVQTMIGCGFPFRGEGVKVLIVDTETRQVQDDGFVGEIWIDSPSKAKGYWGLDEQSREDFGGQPAGSDKHRTPTGYLRTGDLGFLHNEELFICGRLKDLIIVRGSNHYPQDLERTAEASHAGMRPGCSAAFQVAENSEKVVLIAELREEVQSQEHAGIAESIRANMTAEHGVALAAVVLLNPRSIPKTTSGKVARAWCRRAYLGNTLQVLHVWNAPAAQLNSGEPSQMEQPDDNTAGAGATGRQIQPSAAGEELSAEAVRAMSDDQLMATIEEDLVRVSAFAGALPLDRNTPLITLGIDSLSLGQFKGMLEGRYGAQVPDEWLFSEFATLSEMCVVVRNGSLTAAQQQALDEAMAGTADQQQANGPGAAVAAQKQPCCPWFTCCY